MHHMRYKSPTLPQLHKPTALLSTGGAALPLDEPKFLRRDNGYRGRVPSIRYQLIRRTIRVCPHPPDRRAKARGQESDHDGAALETQDADA